MGYTVIPGTTRESGACWFRSTGEIRVGRVKWKVLVAVGVVVAGILVAARRRNLQQQADAELWAEATDPVPSSGG